MDMILYSGKGKTVIQLVNDNFHMSCITKQKKKKHFLEKATLIKTSVMSLSFQAAGDRQSASMKLSKLF